jgi:formyl-CoA transferase
MVASPLRLSDAPSPLRRAPRRGEHTDEVLAEVCGYGGGRIARLRASGALG